MAATPVRRLPAAMLPHGDKHPVNRGASANVDLIFEVRGLRTARAGGAGTRAWPVASATLRRVRHRLTRSAVFFACCAYAAAMRSMAELATGARLRLPCRQAGALPDIASRGPSPFIRTDCMHASPEEGYSTMPSVRNSEGKLLDARLIGQISETAFISPVCSRRRRSFPIPIASRNICPPTPTSTV